MATTRCPPAANVTDRPLAVKGLTSYRYRGPFGWIMIGANGDKDALREAARSLSYARTKPVKKHLEVWSERFCRYRKVR